MAPSGIGRCGTSFHTLEGLTRQACLSTHSPLPRPLKVISVADTATRVVYWFDANLWLDRAQGDGLIERVLPSLSAPPPQPKRMVNYQVRGDEGEVNTGQPDLADLDPLESR